MTREKIIEYWLNSADNDYEVMNSLSDKNHYIWALFVGHLVLEKLLKAYYAMQVGIETPYTHDLTKDLLKNNFTFSHLIFGPPLADPQSQNPQNSLAIPAVLLNRINQIQPQI